MSNMLHNNRKNLDLVDYIITTIPILKLLDFSSLKRQGVNTKKKHSFLQKSFYKRNIALKKNCQLKNNGNGTNFQNGVLRNCNEQHSI